MTDTLQNNKSLSIRISTNGLSFCSYTPLADQPFVYSVYDVKPTVSMAANLREALQNDPILQDKTYKRVNVLVTTQRCTYVPVSDFDADNINNIFEFNFPNTTGMKASYNVLRRAGLAIIFGIDRNMYQLIVDDYPNARFYTSDSTLIEFLGSRSVVGGSKSVFVYLHDESVTLYAFHQGRMLYSNTFRINNVEDSIYYCLSAWKSLGMDVLNDALRVVGDGDIEELFASRIQNFIKNVAVIERTEDFRQTITKGNADIPYDLQTLLVCGF